MRGHEVNRGTALLHMGEEFGYPCRSCSARPPNPQRGVDRLDCLCRQIIELEVRIFIATFPETGEVGFVPHFEEPCPYFVASVAFFYVPDISIDQVVPAFRFRMRCVALPIEDSVIRRGKRSRREAEFNERPDVPGEQIVVESIDLRPVVDSLAVLNVDSTQHVVEYRVKTDVAKAEFIGGELELSLAVIADQDRKST